MIEKSFPKPPDIYKKKEQMNSNKQGNRQGKKTHQPKVLWRDKYAYIAYQGNNKKNNSDVFFHCLVGFITNIMRTSIDLQNCWAKI